MTWTDLVTLSFVVVFFGIGFGFYSTYTHRKDIYPIIIILWGVSMLVPGLILETQEIELHSKQNKDIINSWPCDNLHDNILNQIKNNNSTLLDYQKDLYHFKCEAMP